MIAALRGHSYATTAEKLQVEDAVMASDRGRYRLARVPEVRVRRRLELRGVSLLVAGS